jgi:2-C-methyl-D-erythritol 4-phosphate cytidylyltransferase
MNVAIVVAGGSGRRFGGEVPKQFLEIAGKPVILHTLERFENCAEVDEIVLVLPESESAAKYGLSKLKTVVAGGQTRAESVWNGLQAVNNEAEIVAVHDGARPLVTTEEITATIEKARETGAACLVAPVTDTIKEVFDGQIVTTIDRSKLRRALTPQCFRYDLLQRAFAELNRFTKEATDESFLVEQLGVPVSVVEGSAKNIKITVPEDLILAESLLKEFKV